MLLRDGREQPLIPRYFDLLVFLIERRGDAVHRRDIFDHVWRDVVVSDSALSQAVRTIRRVLGDESREPRFVRTVPRHGYRFVFTDVIEEEDDAEWQMAEPSAPEVEAVTVPIEDRYETLLERLTRTPASRGDEEDQREAAELLHALDTSEALRRLGTRPGHEYARALLRDTRWDSPQAGPVPILGQSGAFATATALVRMRLRRAAAMAAARWARGSLGGGVAGLIAGAIGALLLVAAPGSQASFALVPVLAFVGGCCGALGGAGVGAGLSVAEAVERSRRALVLIAGAALGGAMAGYLAQWLARWTLEALVGINIPIGGGIEGLTIGAAAGLGYSLTTTQFSDGMAAPRGSRRVMTVAMTAIACGVAALLLSLTGRPLVGGTIHLISQASSGSQATLTPLARLVGEPDFGLLTSALIATGEGAMFGLGLALGLTRR